MLSYRFNTHRTVEICFIRGIVVNTRRNSLLSKLIQDWYDVFHLNSVQRRCTSDIPTKRAKQAIFDQLFRSANAVNKGRSNSTWSSTPWASLRPFWASRDLVNFHALRIYEQCFQGVLTTPCEFVLINCQSSWSIPSKHPSGTMLKIKSYLPLKCLCGKCSV